MEDKRKNKSYFWTTTLNMLFPGLGYLYLGRWTKALFFMGISGICLWMIFSSGLWMIRGFSSIEQLAFQIVNGNGGQSVVNVSPTEWLLRLKQIGIWSIVFTFIFFWAIIDATFEVRKLRKLKNA